MEGFCLFCLFPSDLGKSLSPFHPFWKSFGFVKRLQHVRIKCKYPLQGSNKFCATKSLWFLHLIMSYWIRIILFLLVSPTQFSILTLHLIKRASFSAGLVGKWRLAHSRTLHWRDLVFNLSYSAPIGMYLSHFSFSPCLKKYSSQAQKTQRSLCEFTVKHLQDTQRCEERRSWMLC